jgi:hydroxymethylpyrimidine/phosphomethylpyrimidine kinase
MSSKASSTRPPVVLTIAGSDSGGGAGIQADLKTFSAFGVYGTSAITCITAQNPDGVSSIQAIEPGVVAEQIRVVCEGFPVSVAKTGMLFTADIIRAVAAADMKNGIPVLVVDPVMVANSGARLLMADAVDALCADLLPQARVITPNQHEAEILWGHSISNIEELKRAAREIGERFDVACVAKGGHLAGDEVVDVLYDEGEEHVFAAPRVRDVLSHGAGCAFSAALAAGLANGALLHDAVARAKEYVRRALQESVAAGKYRLMDFFWHATFRGPA